MRKLFLMITLVIFMGQGLLATPFIDKGNGTVTDQKTSLVWQKCGLGRNNDASCSDDAGVADTEIWSAALSYCNGLGLASKTWRLPNVNELKSIVDETKSNPAIDTTYFPATVAHFYWSASTLVADTAYAWGVDFPDGLMYTTTKTTNLYVRCVTGP